MKISGLVLALVLLNTAAIGAQVVQITVKPLTDSDIKLIREDIQGAKNDIITNTMQFSEAQGKVFWPLYKEFAGEQRVIAEKRFAVIMDYAKHIDELSDAQASALTQRMLQIEDETQALRKTYFPKFESVLGAKQAAKFYQVDNRLTMILNIQLASEIPLVP